MVQEFHVVRCCTCLACQVHIIRKDRKFSCKMCGLKQSIKKIYGKGTAKDCRLHVQKLNTYIGEQQSENNEEIQSGFSSCGGDDDGGAGGHRHSAEDFHSLNREENFDDSQIYSSQNYIGDGLDRYDQTYYSAVQIQDYSGDTVQSKNIISDSLKRQRNSTHGEYGNFRDGEHSSKSPVKKKSRTEEEFVRNDSASTQSSSSIVVNNDDSCYLRSNQSENSFARKYEPNQPKIRTSKLTHIKSKYQDADDIDNIEF